MTKNISKKYSDNHECCLIEGDVFKEIKNLPDRSVDLIVSSPPYNLNKEYETNKAFDIYLEWLTPLLLDLKRVLKDNGSICWQVGNYVSKKSNNRNAEIFPLDIYFYEKFKALDFKLRNRIIWHFRSGLHAQNRFSGRYETMLWFTKTDDFTFNLDPVRVPQKYQGKTYHKGKKKGQLSGNPKGMNPSDFWFYELMQNEYAEGVWDFPNVKANHPEKTEHPCSFPIELVERCILAFTNEGNVVLDPFSGTGTTALGAIKNNRKAVAIELFKEYTNIAEERIKQFYDGNLPYRQRGRPIGSATGKVAKRVFEEE